MKAFDIMVRDIISVSPDTSVDEAVKLLVEHDLSALPVVENGELVGIISEADLIHRTEIGTETHRPWWLEAMTPASTLAAEFAKSHGKKVSELMSDAVVSASEDASLAEIATLLERHRIKRIPIVAGGRLVGIVSRSNLIQAIAHAQPAGADTSRDRQIRQELLSRLGEQSWTHFGGRNVTVGGGTVHLWGLVGSKEERKALVALAEGVPGVARVLDEMIPAYGEG